MSVGPCLGSSLCCFSFQGKLQESRAICTGALARWYWVRIWWPGFLSTIWLRTKKLSRKGAHTHNSPPLPLHCCILPQTDRASRNQHTLSSARSPFVFYAASTPNSANNRGIGWIISVSLFGAHRNWWSSSLREPDTNVDRDGSWTCDRIIASQTCHVPYSFYYIRGWGWCLLFLGWWWLAYFASLNISVL